MGCGACWIAGMCTVAGVNYHKWQHTLLRRLGSGYGPSYECGLNMAEGVWAERLECNPLYQQAGVGTSDVHLVLHTLTNANV